MTSRYWGNFLYNSAQETLDHSVGSSISGSSCFEIVGEYFGVLDLLNDVENGLEVILKMSKTIRTIN